MPNKFLHIAFKFKDDKAKIEELKPTFDLAVDWFRYAPNCWIVYTTNDAQKWYERLRPKIGEGDEFLVCELNVGNRQGWITKDLWDWLKKERP